MEKALLFALTIISVLSVLSCTKGEEKDLMFFYFESCPSCEEYRLAGEYADRIVTLDRSRQWKGISRNLIDFESADEMRKILKEKALPDISRSLPLLIIGDEYFNGYEAIGSRLDELESAGR